MGLIPLPPLNNVKKNALSVKGGFPNNHYIYGDATVNSPQFSSFTRQDFCWALESSGLTESFLMMCKCDIDRRDSMKCVLFD